ncbi:MAG: epoxyqueuosine reductase QueH [Bacillales bacterium]|nr:epoxyqueuosine reductase QueH [Bacillales bacterium]
MKENYNNIFEDITSKLNYRPKVLLHSCCAPCSSHVVTLLKEYFDVTVLYYNPNIYPLEEYLKRKNEQIKLLEILNIPIMDIDYDHNEFKENVKGLEDEKEGGARCNKCFALRLEKTAILAQLNQFEYFCTTLTVSPYKNSQIINKIGAILEQKYNVKYLYSDFKKKEGYKKSIELSKKYDLYRQHYCGCEYSVEGE